MLNVCGKNKEKDIEKGHNILIIFAKMALILLDVSQEIALQPRDSNQTSMLLLLVFIGTVFVALSRLTNPNLFELVLRNFFRMKSVDKSYNEELRLGILSRVLMSFNFIYSLFLCAYLVISKSFDSDLTIEMSLLISILYFLVIFIGHNTTRLFLQSNFLQDNFSFISASHVNFVGLFFLSFALLWILNQPYDTVFIRLFLWLVPLLHSVRIIKGLNFCFRVKIRWYYLILYLCTIEILPFVFLVKILMLKLD